MTYLEFPVLDESAIRTRTLFELDVIPDLEHPERGSEWKKFISYRVPVSDEEFTHREVVLNEVFGLVGSRVLPIAANYENNRDDFIVCDWYVYPHPMMAVRGEAVQVAKKLCAGMLVLEARGLVEIDFIFDQQSNSQNTGGAQ